MTEVRQGPTPHVRFREVSVKRELTVNGPGTSNTRKRMLTESVLK